MDSQNDLIRPSARIWVGAPALLVLACATTRVAAFEHEVPEGWLPDSTLDTPDESSLLLSAAYTVVETRRALSDRIAALTSTFDYLAPESQPLVTQIIDTTRQRPRYIGDPPLRRKLSDPARSHRQTSAP